MIDFINGWEEGTLEQIIDECPIEGDGIECYNPAYNCNHILTENTSPSGVFVIVMSKGSALMKSTLSILFHMGPASTIVN
jgi:hypothetical protein